MLTQVRTRKLTASSQEDQSLQQSSSGSGVVDHGCRRVGGELVEMEGGDFEGGASR